MQSTWCRWPYESRSDDRLPANSEAVPAACTPLLDRSMWRCHPGRLRSVPGALQGVSQWLPTMTFQECMWWRKVRNGVGAEGLAHLLV